MADKRLRNRLAKSEVWMLLALTAQRWCDERVDDEDLSLADSDPLIALCVTYDLTPKDLARLLTQVAQQCENRALKVGYEDAWVANA